MNRPPQYKSLFFIPQAYNFAIRIKSMPKYLSWLFINLFATTYYTLLPLFTTATHPFPLRTTIATATLTFGIHYLYEFGYIYNDTIGTRHETNPTLRLTTSQQQYFTTHILSITLTRISIFILSMYLTYLALPTTRTIYAIVAATLCPLLFLAYNHWRSHHNVWLYLPLVISRFIPFAWLSPTDHTPTIALLLILIYPLEIWLERFSIEKYRFRFMRNIISAEQDKPAFRAIYYLIATTSICIYLYLHNLSRLLIIPFIIFAAYRTFYWAMQRK